MLCQKAIALKKKPTTMSQLGKLEMIRRHAWLLGCEWRYWRTRSLGSPSVAERGFKHWRSKPRWYMHSVLVEDCVNRGGCCSRDTGCCVSHEREISSTGELGIGHCTVECDCCSNARGFDLTVAAKNVFNAEFGFLHITDDEEESSECSYQYPLCCASVWGLVKSDSIVSQEPFVYLSAPPPLFAFQINKSMERICIVEDSDGETDSTIVV